MRIQSLENYTLSIYDVKDQLKRMVYSRSQEAFADGDEARDTIQTKEQLEERRTYLRTKFIEAIGGLPPMDTPLNARVLGAVAGDGFSIEKVVYESRPNTFVTANLYVPEDIKSPRGAVLFMCGHHDEAKHHPEYQTVCQYLVQTGLVVMAIDPIGQGERLSYYEPSIQKPTVRGCTGEHDYAGSQCWPLGDGLARYFVHDGMRAIDYLCTRPEVDPAKIGVTGNSGGGTQVSLMMICDPRIAAAAPATFIMSREIYQLAGGAQDAEQIWPGMSALGFDHEDILLSLVPKPVLVMAVRYDFFPLEGTRRTIARTKRFWDMYGAGDCLQSAEDNSVHRYTSVLAKTAAQFFSKHLLGEAVTPSDDRIKPFEPASLWCTRSGQVRGEFPEARAVYEENWDRADELEALRSEHTEEQRREKALFWLREKVFSLRKPCDLNPRLYMMQGQVDELQVYNAIWWAQEGIFNHAFVFRDCRYEGIELPVTFAVWDGGTSRMHAHLQWLRHTCAIGRAVIVLDVSGVGPLTPHSLMNNDPLELYEIIHKLTNDLMWLNDSMAALRTFDVIRALDLPGWLPHMKSDDLQLYASGCQGMYGELASVLDRRIRSIKSENGLGSVADWVRSRHYDTHDIMSVVLPGMLHYFDLPDLVKWRTQVIQKQEV
ncbi:alpha/beta hydrolase [Paenibacillus solisilvae]|uniref:Alpha/beta hydrolase n=1 Tax=Paenibacillus solisilvae TaxID=2486751 RepID=A0ABW0W9F2_9BACL